MTAAQAIAYLRSPLAIRARCEAIYQAGLAGSLEHFRVDLEALPGVVDEVVRVTRERYPELRIPVFGRINQFGADRAAALDAKLGDDRARAWIDLVVVSVLLDADAGEQWTYRDGDLAIGRSEGLAVASLRAFEAGVFSSDPARPLTVDAGALASLDHARLAAAFQSSGQNLLPGMVGRINVLRALGAALGSSPTYFPGGRPGGLLDYFRSIAPHQLPAAELLITLLEGLSPVWPGGIAIEGVDLGDVGRHRAAGGSGPTEGLVPFHGPSQWLAYSLLEPLERAGLPIAQPEALTGLADDRHGGLFVDLGVLVPTHARARAIAHPPGSELIVEWRALTVALLDRVATSVRERLGASPLQMPLACVLEGGTWAAGRAVAGRLRPGGVPPIRIEADGTQ